MGFFRDCSTMALLFAGATSLKVGHLSDLHMHLKYDKHLGPRPAPEEGDCMVGSGVHSDIVAPMGRYGCDPNVTLLENLLYNFNESFGKQDVVFVSGDIVAHHASMPLERNVSPEQTYSLLLDTYAGVNELLAYYFPDTLVLPVIGNDDTKFHDNPIPDEDKDFFYDYVYNLWFRLLPGNVKNLTRRQKEEIEDTFREGGFYRVDLNEKLTLLALNTLYYDAKRDPHIASGSGVQQMFWMKNILAEENDRKYIIMMHVYPGVRTKAEQMWNHYPTRLYFDILKEYSDKIILEVGGHDHVTSLRYHTMSNTLDMTAATKDSELFHNLLIGTAMTPWYNTNPGT